MNGDSCDVCGDDQVAFSGHEVDLCDVCQVSACVGLGLDAELEFLGDTEDAE